MDSIMECIRTIPGPAAVVVICMITSVVAFRSRPASRSSSYAPFIVPFTDRAASVVSIWKEAVDEMTATRAPRSWSTRSSRYVTCTETGVLLAIAGTGIDRDSFHDWPTPTGPCGSERVVLAIPPLRCMACAIIGSAPGGGVTAVESTVPWTPTLCLMMTPRNGSPVPPLDESMTVVTAQVLSRFAVTVRVAYIVCVIAGWLLSPELIPGICIQTCVR